MKYWIGGIVVLLLAWFGLKNFVYNVMMTRGASDTFTSPDYGHVDGWASQPEADTPGAWVTPWGVDIFLVYPASRVVSKEGMIEAKLGFAHPSHLKLHDEVMAALPADASVYVPTYRALSNARSSQQARFAPTSAEDLQAAFEAYLAGLNRGRAIMLVSVGDTAKQIEPLLERLQMEDLQYRFAGFVHMTADAHDDESYQSLSCNPALSGACYQSVALKAARPIGDHLLPRLPKLRANYGVIDSEGTATAISAQSEQVSVWLDANAPKPAEPLFGFEAIESAPIFRPGESEPLPTAPED